MPRIYLIRHGDTIYNRDTVFRGTLDVPLSDVGREQARLTGLELAGAGIGRIVSSPLSRALDTARAVAQNNGIEPEVDPAFTDLDFGDWQGKSKDEVAVKYPELFEKWRRAPHTVRFPGGETIVDVAARAFAALETLTAGNRESALAVATHRVVVKLLVLRMLGLPDSEFWRIMVNTCGISVFDLHPEDGYVLIRHNHTAHLSPLREKLSSADF